MQLLLLLQDSNKHSAAPAASVDIHSPMSERHPTLVDAASDLALSQLDALSHAHHYYNQNHSFIYTQRNAWEMLYDRTIDCSLRSQETPVEEACACSPLVHVTSLMDVVMEKEEERGGEVESEVVVMGKGGDDKRMSGEKDDGKEMRSGDDGKEERTIPNSITNNITNNTIPNSITNNITNTIPNNITNTIPNNITNTIPNNITNTIPNNITNNTIPNNITNTIPNNITNTIPNNITNTIPNNITNTIPNNNTLTNTTSLHTSPSLPSFATPQEYNSIRNANYFVNHNVVGFTLPQALQFLIANSRLAPSLSPRHHPLAWRRPRLPHHPPGPPYAAASQVRSSLPHHALPPDAAGGAATLRLARGESHQPHALRKPGELRLLVLRVAGTPPHATRADS